MDKLERIRIGSAGLIAAGLLLCAAQETQDIAYVSAERSVLRGLAQPEGAPELGALLRGTAVRVQERREGFARVSIEGWVPLAELGASPLQPPVEPTARPAAKPVEAPPPPAPRVLHHDLSRVHHVQVDAARRAAKGGALVLFVRCELRTANEQPVAVDGAPIAATLSIFEERRIAAGRARGELRLERKFSIAGEITEIEIPLADLGERPLPLAIVSARVTLPGDRSALGAATDVDLGRR